MSNNRSPITIVELDLDYCSLTYGTSPCTAALNGVNPHKCFNSFATCQSKPNFNKTVLTYRFVQPRSDYPKGATTFPCLVDTSGRSAQANIAGSDEQLYALGKRAVMSATFDDFPYHDRFMDKYQSERLSGAAQLSGVGYNPKDRGTFWTKFKARNPNYAGRPMREITGFLVDGVLEIETTRHFIITEIVGPDTNGRVTVEGKDVLKLADDDRALAPQPSRGKLTVDMADSGGVTFALNPSGIGDEYSASGFAAIGSELVSFTRSGDNVTVTGRGLNGTSASSHSVDDTFQETFSPRLAQVHVVIRDLLLLAGVDPAFIPFADWTQEVNIWATNLFLTADIMKPEGVSKLIGELAVLGLTIWWDEIDQEIKLLVNHPAANPDIKPINDRNNIITASQEDKSKDRLTEILFNSVQLDPANGVDEKNFARGLFTIDAEAKLPQSYGDTRIKTINCRWLNHGDDATVRILSKRLLNRFRDTPRRYTVEMDYRDDVKVADVVELTSDILTSPTGELQSALTQVIMSETLERGSRVKAVLQNFQFGERYAYFTDNARPNYNASSAAQKLRGGYWSDATEIFDDNTEAYKFI